MQLHSPLLLLLFLILPAAAWYGLKGRGTAAVKFSTLRNMADCGFSWRIRLRPVLVLLRLLCLGLLVIAVARPRKGTVLSEISTEGVALEIVVDRSGSMESEMDYYGEQVSRLDAVKRVVRDFVKGTDQMKGRSSDLMGLVTFARYADTVCPLVLGHDVMLEFLKNTEVVPDRSSENATAIGDALALAAARLKSAEQQLQERKSRLTNADEDSDEGFTIKSKAVILLTDGINNAGEHDPLKAAELASEWGIKVYAIGLGSDQAFRTVNTLMGTMKVPVREELDEQLLKEIAESTGGFYGKATDSSSLTEIMRRIDQLEKTNVKSVQYVKYAEQFGPWAMAAGAVLLLEMLAGCTVFRKIP